MQEVSKLTESYNGYTNYETWLMALTLEDSIPDECREIVENNDDLYDAGKEIKAYVENGFYILEYGIIYIGGNSWTLRDFQEIDWTDVAECFMEE